MGIGNGIGVAKNGMVPKVEGVSKISPKWSNVLWTFHVVDTAPF